MADVFLPHDIRARLTALASLARRSPDSPSRRIYLAALQDVALSLGLAAGEFAPEERVPEIDGPRNYAR
jgi:hypothetical protein